MATSSRQLTWHGTDANLATSLLEYGLVVRYVSRQKSWQCIYRHDNDANLFSNGWITEYDLKDMFITGWAKEKLVDFCRYIDKTWIEWLDASVASRISDVISYFGPTNIFENDHTGGKTLDEVCKELKIKPGAIYEYETKHNHPDEN